MMCDENRMFPPLDDIQAEGRQVIDDIVDRTVKALADANGRFPIALLARLSPAPRSAVLRKLAVLAATPASREPPGKRLYRKRETVSPPAKRGGPSQPKSELIPPKRIATGWASMRRYKPDYQMYAFQRGMIAAALVGILAILLIEYFRL